jgi:Kef-type K+ transport system membrane component KefB
MELSLLNLLLVLAIALAGGMLASRLGYPAILGELLFGIVFGPPVLGVVHGEEALGVLGEVGILLMMLYIGLHMNPSDLTRASRPGVLAAIGGFIVPATLGFGAAIVFGFGPMAGAFIGLAMGVTSLATKSRILADLEILDTRIAHVLMAGALLSDTAALIAFAGIVSLASLEVANGFGAAGEILRVSGQAALFLVAAYLAGTRLFPAGGRLLTRLGITDRGSLFLVVVLTGLGFAELAEVAGLHGILGAFLAGLFLDTKILGRRVGREVEHLLRTVSIGFLAPVFFVSAGFEVTFDVFRSDLAFLVAVVVLATAGKILGTTLFYLPTGLGWREGVAVGAGMNGRGAVEIIVAEIALELGLIGRDVFSILVFMALATTATVPIFLTMAVKWLRRRGELVRPRRREGVVIVGAGPVARHLGSLLGEAHVWLIDTNPEHARLAAAKGLQVVVGDALDEDVLVQACTGEAGRFISMTPNAKVNLLTAQLAAAGFAVPEIQVAVGSSESTTLWTLLAEIGAVALFHRPIDLADWDHALARGRAREVTIDVDTVPGGPDALGFPRADFDQAAEILPLVVLRGQDRLLFAGAGDLEAGDRVIALTRRPATGTAVDPSARVESPAER